MLRTDRPNDSFEESRGQPQPERLRSPRNYGSIESNRQRSTTVPDSSIISVSASRVEVDMKSTVSFLQKFGFGLGHVYNDLCAGVWFSYTLLFMQSVLGISAPEAGALVMLGQVSDAISTPIVGLLADRYGTKRKWHILGTGLVFLSFPMIFSICPGCSTMPGWWQLIYFSIFIVTFQFAWAVVQITHLAMIPELSKTTKDRSDLTATRYSASICANLVVFITMWAELQGRGNMNNNIGPSDAYRFRDIALILTLVGVSMSVIFHFSIAVSDYEQRRVLLLDPKTGGSSSSGVGDFSTQKTGSLNASSTEVDCLINTDVSSVNTDIDLERTNNTRTSYTRFLKSPLLYQNAFLYVFARLFMTTSLVYMPLWLDERSLSPPATNESPGVEHLATVPLVSFLASFVSAVALKHANRWNCHQIAYLLGSLVSLIGCVWIAVDTPTTTSTVKLFGIAILFGSGSSVTMISSLCITADMIGKHAYQGGFIYSAVTFADKLITGIVVVIIEALKCNRRSDCPEYYRSVLAYGCGIAATLGIVVLATLRCIKLRKMQ